MQIRTEEMDDIVDRSLVMVLGREGHTVYLRNPATKQASPIPGAIGLTKEQAERYCRLMRWHIAAIVTAILTSDHD